MTDSLRHFYQLWSCIHNLMDGGSRASEKRNREIRQLCERAMNRGRERQRERQFTVRVFDEEDEEDKEEW